LFGRIEFLDIHRGQAVPHRQVDGFTRLMVQFLKIWQTEPANIELPKSGLPDREARNSQVADRVSTTIQKSRAMQIHQEAVYRAHGKAGKTRNLLGSESAWRFAEQMEKVQASLQRRDVVASSRDVSHGFFRSAKMKVRNI
jgi:hypothetical protein